MITWMKNVNNFQKVKFSLRVSFSICLILCQFQPGVAYKSAAYKKTCIFVTKISANDSSHLTENFRHGFLKIKNNKNFCVFEICRYDIHIK